MILITNFITPLEKSKQICNNRYMDREYGVDEMKEFRMLKTLDVQGIEPNGGGVALSSNVSKLGSKEEFT